jgi:hypothetical protein
MTPFHVLVVVFLAAILVAINPEIGLFVIVICAVVGALGVLLKTAKGVADGIAEATRERDE